MASDKTVFLLLRKLTRKYSPRGPGQLLFSSITSGTARTRNMEMTSTQSGDIRKKAMHISRGQNSIYPARIRQKKLLILCKNGFRSRINTERYSKD
jgi:hypothetical protein